MTDKQPPEPLSLADEADTADDAGHTTARKANAYYLCLLSDCSQMIRRQYAELETLALYKNLADEYGLSIFKDLKDLTTEVENLREKLKTYEDLGGAADDMQLLRMGYASARLEIESLKAQLAERAKEHADELAVAYMCGASRENEIARINP